MVIALLLAPHYTTENVIGVRFPMLKPRRFPAIPRLRGQSISYCPAPLIARLFPGYPSRWDVDTNDLCLKIDGDN